MSIKDSWRQIRRLPNPRAYARDSNRFVASARRYCLLIFAIGLLAPLLTLHESERRATYFVFSFVEKILKIVDAVTSDNPSQQKESIKIGEAIGSNSSTVFQMVLTMSGSSHAAMVIFDSPNERLATLVDVNNTCPARVLQLQSSIDQSADKVAIDVMLPAQIQATTKMSVSPESIFLIEFERSCYSNIPAAEPFVVVKYNTDAYGVSLSPETYGILGVEWLADGEYIGWQGHWVIREVLKTYLSQDQIERIVKFEKPFLNVLDVHVLKTIVLGKARSITGEQYMHTRLDHALQAIFKYTNEPESLVNWWIFSASQSVVVSSMPIVLFIFAFFLQHRLRRIDPNSVSGKEPWIIIRPQGWIESAGAISWIVLHFTSLASITWSVWEYNHDQLGIVAGYWRLLVGLFPNESLKYSGLTAVAMVRSPLFWILTVNLVSAVLIVFAARYMWRLMSPGEQATNL